MQVIEIPAGSRFIAAWELGRRIGELLHPTPDGPPLLATLQKKVAEAEPKHFRIEELSDDDLLYLRAVWKGIDIPDALNMTREQWAQCKAAFQAAPDRPTWELVAVFRDYANEARSEQFRIANKHVQTINGQIRMGKMRAYDADLTPVQKVDGWTSQVSVEDARAYLAHLGIELRASASPAAPEPQAPTAAGRYTLWDAAKAIGGATAAPFERVLDALVSSANAGELTIYQAGATFPHRPDGPLGALAGHEAYWSDLNAWLRAHKVQGDFEFPAPQEVREALPDTDDEVLAFELAREDEINGGPIDWERWTVKSATLTAAQAARLMAGLDPDKFESLALTRSDKAGPAKAHARRLEQLAAADEPPKARDTPARWLAWADAKREKVHGPYRLAIEQAAKAAAPAEQAATVAAQGTPAEQWKAADAQGKVNLAIEAMREHGTQEKAAKALKISRQRLAEKLPADLRKGSRKGSAALASPFPESPWKPHKR